MIFEKAILLELVDFWMKYGVDIFEAHFDKIHTVSYSEALISS